MISFGSGQAAPRPYLVKQEFVVLAIDDEHDRLFVDEIVALTLAHPPVLGEKRLQFGDLHLKIVGCPTSRIRSCYRLAAVPRPRIARVQGKAYRCALGAQPCAGWPAYRDPFAR